jgi:hypothetical protein
VAQRTVPPEGRPSSSLASLDAHARRGASDTGARCLLHFSFSAFSPALSRTPQPPKQKQKQNQQQN